MIVYSSNQMFLLLDIKKSTSVVRSLSLRISTQRDYELFTLQISRFACMVCKQRYFFIFYPC
jgi:hypothetical protein